MNCIIVDDDELAIKLVKQCIERVDFITLIGTASSGTEALNLLEKNKDIDLVLLDIDMPGMTGFDLVKNFKIPQVIFITGNKEYAAEAYDYNVTDFILKPIDFTRFLKAVQRAKEVKESIQVSKRNENEIYLKKSSRLIRVDARDIIYVEAQGDYVNIYTAKERFTILSTMKSVENRLPKIDFARIHNSYIIRLDKIVEIEDETISLGGKSFPISRSHKNSFFQKLNLF
ncbi:MAG: LytTR family DNA-binding domain-containing protein [Bacteroidia bacterium]|nr:LytTR family DNA-binding domain-containing protein [Bacteroidia bacterium]